MINIKDLDFASSDLNLKSGDVILISINKKIRFHRVYEEFVEEFNILPKLTKEKREMLLKNNLNENIYTIFKEDYFIFPDKSGLKNMSLPLFKSCAKKYVFSSYKKVMLPEYSTYESSLAKFNKLDLLIQECFIRKNLQIIEESKASQNPMCFEVICSLLPDQIPKEYIILYHDLSTYLLLDAKLAISETKRKNGMLKLYIDEKYIKHVVGINGKNIGKIKDKLGIPQIAVFKKK